MDTRLILEFQTEAAAHTCLNTINGLAAQYWIDKGYTVINGQLIGKNASTGEDMPSAARTTTWDVVKESPDSTFYFSSLSNDQRFEGGMDQIDPQIYGYTEKVFPPAWINVTKAQENF